MLITDKEVISGLAGTLLIVGGVAWGYLRRRINGSVQSDDYERDQLRMESNFEMLFTETRKIGKAVARIQGKLRIEIPDED